MASDDIRGFETDVTCDDWTAIDRTLQGLAKQRAALDAEEARWLRAANRVQIWRQVGFVSMIDYMERRLGYGVRAAQERLRVALVLAELPSTTQALEAGALPFTGIRALARVVTPETEKAWLQHCGDKSVHQIEDAVSGHDRGALPTDAKQPELQLRTLRYDDIRPSTVALEREALARARAQLGGHIEHDQFLALMFGTYLAAGQATMEPARAKYQVAITQCRRCKQAWRQSSGEAIAIDAAEVARAMCDAQHIGSLDAAVPARATQDIPPRVRRLVWRRDGGRCSVPGCRSKACLELHHINPRENGGTHDPWNVMVLCDSCHASLHRGLITITGRAPDQLVITRRHQLGAHVCAPTQLDRVTIDVRAKAALVEQGVARADAATAVRAARANVRADVDQAILVREALRHCPGGPPAGASP